MKEVKAKKAALVKVVKELVKLRGEISKHGETTMKKQRHQQASDLPIELAQPARRALVQAGYRRLEQLTQLSEAEVKQLHGVGPKAIDQLRRALGAKGLQFRVVRES